MSASVPFSAPKPPRWQKRLISFIASAIIGPALTGLLLGFGFLVQDAILWKLDASSILGPLAFAVFALPIGLPFVLLPGLVGLWLYRKTPTIPLGAFLGIAAASVLLLFIVVSRSPKTLDDASAALVLLIPALLSAAICWRSTKHWHSPEPKP